MAKLESLSGGSGVHVFLVLWKAARAVEAYAEKSITELEMCGSDFAVLEALLHKGPLPVNEIGKKVLLTSGSITAAVDRLEKEGTGRAARARHGSAGEDRSLNDGRQEANHAYLRGARRRYGKACGCVPDKSRAQDPYQPVEKDWLQGGSAE